MEPAHVENNEETTLPAEGGVTGRGFVKGRSGNPSGRPKGLARKVRELAGDNDGEVIARFWLAGMNGRLPNPDAYDAEGNRVEGVKTYVTVDPKDRILCSRLLSERGWGKPPMFAPIDDDDPLDFAEREAEEVAVSFDARMDELAAKRASAAAKRAIGAASA